MYNLLALGNWFPPEFLYIETAHYLQATGMIA